jgi:hypothetical protein
LLVESNQGINNKRIEQVRQKAPSMNGPSSTALLSVVFATGFRPDAAALRVAGAAPTASGFAVTLQAKAELIDWAELLASGLTFDCHGIAPGPTAPEPPDGTLLGLSAAPAGEAITLHPGPHIAGGAALLPVIRMLLALASDLARLPGVQAVCWHPAKTWMAPDYFARIAADWLGGGAFPALGLTALTRDSEGGLSTTGLNFFVEQELTVPPKHGLSAEGMAKLAIRVIDTLVTLGPVVEPRALELDGQLPVLLVPDASGSRLTVSPPLNAR